MDACAERWKEEVTLLQEEMKRVITFLKWKAANWCSLIPQRKEVSQELHSGLHAYVNKEASMYDQFALKFVQLWYPIVREADIIHDWEARYPRKLSKATEW